MVAQFSTTKGPPARFERRCSMRAATSLPLPGGPDSRTRLPVGATRSTAWRSWVIAVDTPISSISVPDLSRSSSFSRFSRADSRARSRISSRRSALNGFSMKS